MSFLKSSNHSVSFGVFVMTGTPDARGVHIAYEGEVTAVWAEEMIAMMIGSSRLMPGFGRTNISFVAEEGISFERDSDMLNPEQLPADVKAVEHVDVAGDKVWSYQFSVGPTSSDRDFLLRRNFFRKMRQLARGLYDVQPDAFTSGGKYSVTHS